MALYRLSFHDTAQPRWSAVGLSGVWGWRGRIGRVLRPNGGYRDLKGVIPDFDRIQWSGRMVFIVFDSDVDRNSDVANARTALSRELLRRGARVRWVNLLPSGITV